MLTLCTLAILHTRFRPSDSIRNKLIHYMT